VAALKPFLADRKESPLAPAARTLRHRAQLEMALDLVDADKGSINIEAAADALSVLSKEPADYGVVAAKIALATLTFVTKSSGDPEAVMADAMKTWQALDTAPAATRTGVERDAIDVRNAVFKPKGGGVFESNRWNAFRWEGANTPYLVANPQLRVRSSDGSTAVVTAYDAFPDWPNVLFLDAERRAMLERVMLRLGGSKKLPWTQVMQTPNRPAGPALDVLALWKRSFWVQPGHWGGWVFESYPIIDEIEFVNAERTKAAVTVTIGYSGGTVQLVKENGVWIAREISNIWIT